MNLIIKPDSKKYFIKVNIVNRIKEVDVIRLLAIVLVVFSHCFALFNGSWSNPNQDYISEIKSYTILTDFISSFRMPAVVLVAGYIFMYFGQKRKQNLLNLVSIKFKRLIFPMLFFGILYLVIFNSYDVNQFIRRLSAGPGHLWFLPMLFWNFLFGFYLIKIRNRYFQILIFFFLFVISGISPYLPSLFSISKAAQFLVYFYFGSILWRFREYILNNFLNNSVLLVYFVLYLLIFVLFAVDKDGFFFSNEVFSGFFLLVVNIIGVFYFYLIIMYLIYKKEVLLIDDKYVKLSYGIYIFHQFILIYLIYNLHIYKIIQNVYILPVFLFVVSLLGSIVLTYLFLKTRLGRYLIG